LGHGGRIAAGILAFVLAAAFVAMSFVLAEGFQRYFMLFTGGLMVVPGVMFLLSTRKSSEVFSRERPPGDNDALYQPMQTVPTGKRWLVPWVICLSLVAVNVAPVVHYMWKSWRAQRAGTQGESQSGGVPDLPGQPPVKARLALTITRIGVRKTTSPDGPPMKTLTPSGMAPLRLIERGTDEALPKLDCTLRLDVMTAEGESLVLFANPKFGHIHGPVELRGKMWIVENQDEILSLVGHSPGKEPPK
jgi:hypothetical protein